MKGRRKEWRADPGVGWGGGLPFPLFGKSSSGMWGGGGVSPRPLSRVQFFRDSSPLTGRPLSQSRCFPKALAGRREEGEEEEEGTPSVQNARWELGGEKSFSVYLG